MKDKFTEIKHDTQREIAKMSEDGREVYQQLERSREEFDYMKAIQSSCVTDYQAQLADLKQVRSLLLVSAMANVCLLQTLEETEMKLNKTTHQLTNTKDQLRQVREMMTAERVSREKTISQLETAKKKIGAVQLDAVLF